MSSNAAPTPTPKLRASTRLRALLKPGKTLFVPGCYNAMSARVLDHVGFPAIYMSGYGTSLSMLGMPDAGLITMTEMQLNAKYIANAVSVPVIADSDSGFGNAINAMRCVREYIQTGVAAIHIEVAPKRCGHVAGREVIPVQEAVGKIRAADTARQELDPDFMIIARSDARGAHGGSLAAAIDRVNAYLDAGADMAFVEGPTSLDEVEQVCRRVRGPVFYNMTGVSPRMTLDVMQQLGIAITITAGTTMRATLQSVYDVAVKLRDEGPMAEAEFIEGFKKHPLNDVHTFAGFDAIRACEEVFLPAEHLDKYADSIGHQPQQKAPAQ
jgi:2-methylisocitrate lyase-like PEP mutase family enzyme